MIKQIVPIEIGTKSHFNAQVPKNGIVLALTPGKEGFVMHMLHDIDDILVQREFAIVPTGAQMTVTKDMEYMASFMTFHLFELKDSKNVLVLGVHE